MHSKDIVSYNKTYLGLYRLSVYKGVGTVDQCQRKPPCMLPHHLASNPSPLVWQTWEQVLGSHPDRCYANYITSGIRDGFCIGFNYRLHRCKKAASNNGTPNGGTRLPSRRNLSREGNRPYDSRSVARYPREQIWGNPEEAVRPLEVNFRLIGTRGVEC